MHRLIGWFKGLLSGTKLRIARLGGGLTYEATLSATVFRADGTVERLGVISHRVVTSAFVNLLVDTLQSAVAAFSLFKYHDCGTGTGAESAGDVGLGTPFGGARVAGTQIEGASVNIYKSVATIPFTSTLTITEHGLFNATSGVTLMDRSVFTGIPVNNGDSIQFTYELTCNAGG
jgi:hypothetical protein